LTETRARWRMKMRQKNILLVCREIYTMPMHFLAKLLRKEGVNLAALFVYPHEALLNHPHYQFFRENNADIPIFDIKKISTKLIDHLKAKNIQIDREMLEKIESQYTSFYPINLQLMSSQGFTTYYHFDDFNYEASYETHLYWLTLYYQRIEQIFDEFKPDVIYDTEKAGLGRMIILEVAYARGIPYVSLELARFENYWIPTYSLSIKLESFFRKEFESLKEKYSREDFRNSRGFQYLENFRNKASILSEDQKMINPIVNEWKLFAEIKALLYGTITAIKMMLKTIRIRRGVAAPLYANCFVRIKMQWVIFFRNLFIHFLRNGFFCNVNTKELKYVLFPLHVIPESSIFTKAPYFCSESFLLETLSKSVPWDFKILVKEHWGMLGKRPFSFYNRLKKLKNVIIVSPFLHKDPKQYIQDCKGVLTISGTSALEAAFLGKPSIIFGATSFEVLSCVHKISDITKIKDIIAQWDTDEKQVNDQEIVSYIETVLKYGRNISLKTILYYCAESEKALLSRLGLGYPTRRRLKRRLYQFLGRSIANLPSCEELDTKVMAETLKIKEVLEMGVKLFEEDKDIESLT